MRPTQAVGKQKQKAAYLALNIPAMNPIIMDKTSSKILKPRFAIDIKALDKLSDKLFTFSSPFEWQIVLFD
jgi:hypothetical protein